MEDATGQIRSEAVGEWCRMHLDAEPESVLFESQQVSVVLGLHLSDGRDIVVKARPPEERQVTCTRFQRHLWWSGFPCPEPLAGPHPLGDLAATAETFVPGGALLPRSPKAPALYAASLAWLVTLAATLDDDGTLEPAPYWMQPDHDLEGVWSADPHVDLNAYPDPAWLAELGLRARTRMARSRGLPAVVGHADWEAQNLRWVGSELHVAHDWDSLVRRSEAMIAGMTSLIFPSTGRDNESATIAESERFVAAYEAARARRFTDEEREVAWASGLWVGAWKVKKALALGHDDAGDGDLRSQAEERLSRAGA